MKQFISEPTIISAAGNLPKRIEEYFGLINSMTNQVSIARMKSPAGWSEPGQTPEFDEYTVVLHGVLHVQLKNEKYVVKAGQAILISRGTWVKYSSPDPEGAEYIAVCLPAFTPDIVHRDSE